MNDILLHQNLSILEKSFPDFYNALTSTEFSYPGLTLSPVDQEGNYYLNHNQINCLLHSTYNIEREMQELFKPLTQEDNQVILIFGLGYGHCLDYIKKHRIKYKRVIIFEPYNNILFEVLKKRSVKEIFGHKNVFVHLFKYPNEMASFLLKEAMGSKTVKILYHVSYMTLYKDLYDNVQRTFRSEKNSVNTSINTFGYFSNEWNLHQLKSLTEIDANASALLGKFENIPGIIASAGPSLEKHYELLKQVGNQAVIVAPGTSTKIFNQMEIPAHIAMSIDSQIYQAQFYEDFHLDSILVGSHRLHPDVHKNFPNKIMRVVLSTEFLAQYYFTEWIEEEFVSIDDHASVASSAVDLLAAMGCNPIILIGQDLCYSNNKLHAGDKDDVVGTQDGLFEDIDIHGNKVFTHAGFKSMQNDMELLNLKYHNKTKFYNATEGGLNIHGIENAKFQTLFDSFIKNRPNDVQTIIDDAVKSCETVPEERTDNKLSEFYSHILTECESIEKIIAEKESGFSKVEKLKARNVTVNRLNSEMLYIQSFNNKMAEIKFYTKVIFPNIQQQLTYYKASADHITDGSEDYEGMELFEKKLDTFVLDFIDRLRSIVISEMVGIDALASVL